ncbi:hypothetical protein GCM10010123_28510 [Pilimelia anulata]|uniref:Uncharacterized protein n=1 Tax=Pilimelia anulata TaxID=53371 RepID=A0A8J3FAD7_9ACTN|nr:hypothetical protein GCM10010123_28510 [Pilimelia anulata]
MPRQGIKPDRPCRGARPHPATRTHKINISGDTDNPLEQTPHPNDRREASSRPGRGRAPRGASLGRAGRERGGASLGRAVRRRAVFLSAGWAGGGVSRGGASRGPAVFLVVGVGSVGTAG